MRDDKPPRVTLAPRRLWIAASAVALLGAGLELGSRLRDKPWSRSSDVKADQDPLTQALGRGRPAVIQFGANACAACREMKPVLEAIRQQHGSRFTVMSVDLIAQKHRGYQQRFLIQLMPTQVFFDTQGRETGRNLGKMASRDILARLEVLAP